jgi:F-type H+-transporting ATPase subunit alpha
VPVPEQLAILLALTAGLFDELPLERMSEAEQAVRAVMTGIPEALRGRLASAEALSATDREAVIEAARHALAPFLPTPEPMGPA